jgi:hypothetical protein
MLPISAGHKSLFTNVRRSNDGLSNIGACNIASSPPNINPMDKANAWLINATVGAKCTGDVTEGFSALRMFQARGQSAAETPKDYREDAG